MKLNSAIWVLQVSVFVKHPDCHNRGSMLFFGSSIYVYNIYAYINFNNIHIDRFSRLQLQLSISIYPMINFIVLPTQKYHIYMMIFPSIKQWTVPLMTSINYWIKLNIFRVHRNLFVRVTRNYCIVCIHKLFVKGKKHTPREISIRLISNWKEWDRSDSFSFDY